MMKKSLIYKPDKLNPMAQKMLRDQSVSVIVENFHGVNWHEKLKTFPIFTLYHNPTDFPGKYVMRLFDGKNPTRLIAVKDTLEAARATVPKIFYRVPRKDTDDPFIVETWL